MHNFAPSLVNVVYINVVNISLVSCITILEKVNVQIPNIFWTA